jgi:pimeloyl-ACP methyl ester carboxylesterase
MSTLTVPGARLHYEVRGSGPLVVLAGAPMDATAFAPLADLLAADHTVVTTDPRGINRSRLDDPDQDSTPELRADDLARIVTHLDAGPAAVFGSSGGAVTALALVQSHPELVRTAVAHEPPFYALLDDRERLTAQNEDIVATHLSGDEIGAWKKFMDVTGFDLPDAAIEQMVGGRDPQAAADQRRWFAHELRGTAYWEPDLAALRAAAPRIVVGIGEASAGQHCDRTSRALAGALGVEPVMFPGGHIGFVEDPEAFAPRLRSVLEQP